MSLTGVLLAAVAMALVACETVQTTQGGLVGVESQAENGDFFRGNRIRLPTRNTRN